jgi:protoporphyrinogen IX oxidase
MATLCRRQNFYQPTLRGDVDTSVLKTPAGRAGLATLITVGATALAMVVLGARAYDWVKAIHVVAVMSWMAGMLYLPRLFVYHAEIGPGTPQSETFKVMERRLLQIIMTPAMLVSWVLGLWLAWKGGWFAAGWFHGKLALTLAMTGAHGYLAAAVRRFEADASPHGGRHWRIVNEVPTLLMIAIVVLVIVKPF